MTHIKAIAAATIAAIAVTAGTVITAEVANAFVVVTGGGYEGYRPQISQFVDISQSGSGATRVLANTNDSVDSSATIDFNFKFFGTTYNSGTAVNISSNGLLSFGSPNSSGANQSVNSPFGVDTPTIAALWKDWNFTAAGSDAAYYKLQGPPGARSLIVQWNKAADSNGNLATFQAVLREFDNAITFRYITELNPIGAASFSTGGATIGLRNTNGNANGQRVEWSYNTPFSSYEIPALQFTNLTQ
jgi:hypothetical protein